MPKRFTATEIWDQDWYIELKIEYKLFWYYCLSKCNHAGIFKPNSKNFDFLSSCKIKIDEAFAFFNQDKERVKLTQKGNWLFTDFYQFQYGNVLNIDNKVHLSIYNAYNQEFIMLGSIRGLLEVKSRSFRAQVDPEQGLKDKDKDSISTYLKVKHAENGTKSKAPSGDYKAQREHLYAQRLAEGHSSD